MGTRVDCGLEEEHGVGVGGRRSQRKRGATKPAQARPVLLRAMSSGCDLEGDCVVGVGGKDSQRGLSKATC